MSLSPSQLRRLLTGEDADDHPTPEWLTETPPQWRPEPVPVRPHRRPRMRRKPLPPPKTSTGKQFTPLVPGSRYLSVLDGELLTLDALDHQPVPASAARAVLHRRRMIGHPDHDVQASQVQEHLDSLERQALAACDGRLYSITDAGRSLLAASGAGNQQQAT